MTAMTSLLSTKEVAALLGVNEKLVYTLINEKGLPAAKITGKWLFPRHLVEQWVEQMTINHPGQWDPLTGKNGQLVVAGSNDILFERTLALFMKQYPGMVAAFANLGSMGGLTALRNGLCHMATSHLVQEDEQEYNFAYVARELEREPAIINFVHREQGLILPAGNPEQIRAVADLAEKNVVVVNRAPGTGTRLMFDRELARASVTGSDLPGYDREVGRHLDVGLEILAGRAGAGPGIRVVAGLLGLDFLPVHWERFDIIVPKDIYFRKEVQDFLSILHSRRFAELAGSLEGYDAGMSGKIVYPEV
ncbi:MAG: substrate-binding domain-containing protein [Desulfovibrionales bacterium]